MNKSDSILIFSIILVSLILWLLLSNISQGEVTKAYVYYNSKLIKTIDLTKNELLEYKVDGYNGEVLIETKLNQIRVKKEMSPHHLCSKQGWVSTTLETIVCLPNKIVIKLASDKRTELDAIVR